MTRESTGSNSFSVVLAVGASKTSLRKKEIERGRPSEAKKREKLRLGKRVEGCARDTRPRSVLWRASRGGPKSAPTSLDQPPIKLFHDSPLFFHLFQETRGPSPSHVRKNKELVIFISLYRLALCLIN